MARLSIFRTENDAFRRYSNDNARESIESVISVSVKRERRVDSDYLVMRVTNRKRQKTHTILETYKPTFLFIEKQEWAYIVNLK